MIYFVYGILFNSLAPPKIITKLELKKRLHWAFSNRARAESSSYIRRCVFVFVFGGAFFFEIGDRFDFS
jgi:hypothetical protein